ncbi:MAG: YjcQ family protein [Holosporales bacterium]|jgi:hypothetical protein|nr:YjcQ family protein [Holosporales bacterium]
MGDMLKCACLILKILEQKAYLCDDKGSILSPAALGCGQKLWLATMKMLLEDRLIRGIKITMDILGETHVDIEEIRITVSGLTFLEKNRRLTGAFNLTKNIIDIVK